MSTALSSFLKTGLTSEEVQRRQEKFGPNELRKKREFTSLKLLLSQFKSPLIYILVLAGWVTLFLREWTDSVVIFAAVLINSLLGFWQERKAQRSLAALRSLLAQKAGVIRGNHQQEIEAKDLVPGDLVILTIGSRVPADGVLVEAKDLSVNEAILTGESMPVKKRMVSGDAFIISNSSPRRSHGFTDVQPATVRGVLRNQVFMGTTVTTGIAKMVVTQTGMKTEMGKIGQRVGEVEEEKTPLQVQLAKLANVLAMAVGVITLFIFLLGEILGYGPLEMFTTSVAVAVAAIPEGLVVTLTVILALGMQRILKRKAIVRKLLAAETLGSVSVICADKTGTLTEGKMRVVKALTGVSRAFHLTRLPAPYGAAVGGQGGGTGRAPREEWLVKAAILCNDMRDPLEAAMWEWALNQKQVSVQGKPSKIDLKIIKKQYPRIDEIPFSPRYKYIATLHHDYTSEVSPRRKRGPSTSEVKDCVFFLSGAPEIVINKCKIKNEKLKIWLDRFEKYGKKSYRLVGFAYKEFVNCKLKIENSDLKDLVWLGILIYEDPVREGVKAALRECQEAGIAVKVITGDYASTAVAVLKQLDLKIDVQSQVMTGVELETVSDRVLKEKVDHVVLFARTTPEQKLKIVQALKEKGEVVAMTGDGVNDAPALKVADIGIVVSDASDVAQETADIVLLDSNFSTIVEAIEEGRNIFENIKKVVLYLLSDSFTEIILIGGSLILGLPLPVTAAQILWVNLVEDSLPGIALAFEPEEKELMKDLPRSRQEPILDLKLKVLIFIIGLLTDLVLFAIFWWLIKVNLDFSLVQTLMFVALGINSLFYIFACRSLRKPIFKYNLLGNRFLVFSVLFGFLLLFLAVYFPPLQILLKTRPFGFIGWIFLFGLGWLNLLAIELTKWAFIIRKRGT